MKTQVLFRSNALTPKKTKTCIPDSKIDYICDICILILKKKKKKKHALKPFIKNDQVLYTHIQLLGTRKHFNTL